MHRNIEVRSRSQFCRGKAIYIYIYMCIYIYLYSYCNSATLFIRLSKAMRRITLSSLASLARPYLSTLSHKLYEFQRKLLNIKFGF